MLAEARRLNLPEHAYTGGIIIDEMSIQKDLQISKNGDVIELVGFEDIGEEGNMCSIIRNGKNEKVLGSHALQFMFLSVTGFRFPFAHFISTNIQGFDLHNLFWEAVGWLKKYAFTVAYVCLDGAQTNRTFMHINIGKEQSTFVCTNPSPYDPSVVFIMDPSHVFKKIRNNILKSGIGKGFSRTLTLPNENVIHWKMWENAFSWDKSNALQIHKKLTNDHINLTSQSKMRNHLAEEALNSEMLHLMQEYQKSLTNQTVLDGAVELLGKTACMINIFKDKRPIATVSDIRLEQLQEVSMWFDQWAEGVDMFKNKAVLLMSSQCLEDIKSCLIGFTELCRLLLLRKEMEVIPAMVNSDIIENMFCQQRASYNGANTNPNALQYRHNINSIILGQTVVSQKSNAGKSVIKSPIINYIKHSSTTSKFSSAHSSSTAEYTRIKVIKM
jgi:hypothetical protein